MPTKSDSSQVRIHIETKTKLAEMARANRRFEIYELDEIVDAAYEQWKKAKDEHNG